VNDPRIARSRQPVPHGIVRADLAPQTPGPSNLADILERVLDKGIVIAGDIQVNLLDIELLTIKIRLLVASVDRAKEMGINWWESDPTLTREAQELVRENDALRSRLDRLEERMLSDGGAAQPESRERVEVIEETKEDEGARSQRTVIESEHSTGERGTHERGAGERGSRARRTPDKGRTQDKRGTQDKRRK
jgi:hypothetical protein